MGAILTSLERLLEKQGRRRAHSPSSQSPPYPDASKAVRDFQMKLAERVRAIRDQSQTGWKRE